MALVAQGGGWWQQQQRTRAGGCTLVAFSGGVEW